MAPSLRELIDFLLAEIALCGDQGQFVVFPCVIVVRVHYCSTDSNFGDLISKPLYPASTGAWVNTLFLIPDLNNTIGFTIESISRLIYSRRFSFRYLDVHQYFLCQGRTGCIHPQPCRRPAIPGESLVVASKKP